MNNESGARTGLSGIIMGVIMGSALLFMTPLFTDIPQVGHCHLRILACHLRILATLDSLLFVRCHSKFYEEISESKISI